MHIIKWIYVRFISELFVGNFKKVIENLFPHIQVVLSKINMSNGSKHWYGIPIIQFLDTVKHIQVFKNKSFICTQLNGSMYCYVTKIIQVFFILKQFQVFHTNSFIYKHLNDFLYCNVITIIQFSLSVIGFQFGHLGWSNDLQAGLANLLEWVRASLASLFIRAFTISKQKP